MDEKTCYYCEKTVTEYSTHAFMQHLFVGYDIYPGTPQYISVCVDCEKEDGKDG